jgi:hypothetical protein
MKIFAGFCCDLSKLIYICIPHSSSIQTRKGSKEKSKKFHFEFGKKKKAFIFANRFEKKVSQHTQGSLKF